MPNLAMFPKRQSQRGATTLISIMVLFFIMALVAAYGSRNMIVEQRVARTYQELGVASEGAQQALARVVSLLNSGRINASCEPSAAGAYTLRDWLLVFKAQGRVEIPTVLGQDELDRVRPFPMICDRQTGGNWVCQCPSDYKPVPNPEAAMPGESFFARLRGGSGIGSVDISVYACAGASARCHHGEDSSIAADVPLVGRLQSLSLLRAVKMPPVSPLVSTGRVSLGSGMKVVNNEANSGGLALQAGGIVDGSLVNVSGPSGTPSTAAMLTSDPSLAPLDSESLFRRHFGMAMSDYTAQPAIRELRCSTRCASALQTLLAAGHQLIWKEGDLRLDEDVVLGSTARPFVLVVKGRLTLFGPMRLQGLVFSAGAVNWTNASASPSLLQGSLLVAGDVVADGGAVALYDGDTVETLKLRAGSFVPMPGGLWKH